MRKILLITTFILILPSLVYAKSYKRGVGENKFQYLAQMEAVEPGISWFYNWSTGYGDNLGDQEYLEFIPMCWNGGYNADEIRNYCIKNPETKYLLGFNEPNFKSQSNMTPSEAAAAWPGVKELADELGLELVAPALNYSPDAPYTDPLTWMDEFVALVGPDSFDYTAIHAYGGFGVLKDLATKFHEKYGKPVWVTEFCYWPGETGGVSVSSQIGFMMESVEWLEKTDWIHRYAWFKGTEQTEANFNLIAPGKGEETRELTEQGKVYLYMSDFDPEIYHPVNTPIAASDYISQSFAILGSSKDNESPAPIEITQFNAGATLDYQFDVPSEGDYNLTLRVSGMGEPTRFDPNLGIVAINENGEEGETLSANKQFSLSNDESVYWNVVFPMTLKAGKQTLRIKDFAPYQPSGIHISTVNLMTSAGINEIKEVDKYSLVNVYNLQGTCVLKNVYPDQLNGALPKGFYIIGGRKVMVK